MRSVLVRKMSSLRLLKAELVLGVAFSAILAVGIPVSIFCLAPQLLTEPVAIGLALGTALFFGLIGYALFVRPWRRYLALPDVQLEHDGKFLYVHGKKEAVIPLADLTYVRITAELPFLFHGSFLREILIHLFSEEYGRIDLDVDGFGRYKLHFVPFAKETEGRLLEFFNGVMSGT